MPVRLGRSPAPPNSRKSVVTARVAMIAAAALFVAGCAAAGKHAAVTPAVPCVGAAAPATYSHVVVVLMENKSYDQIIGSPSAPYIKALASKCGLATQYHGVGYPSLPNYLAITGGSTFGIKDDGPPASHPITGGQYFQPNRRLVAVAVRIDAGQLRSRQRLSIHGQAQPGAVLHQHPSCVQRSERPAASRPEFRCQIHVRLPEHEQRHARRDGRPRR